MPQAHFSVIFARNLAHQLTPLGISTTDLCRHANFPASQLALPDFDLDGPSLDRLWNAAVALTANPNLGLALGAHFQPAALGLPGYAMLSSATLGQALEKLARYWNLLSNASRLHLSPTPTHLHLTLDLHDLPGNFLRTNRQPVDSSLIAARSLLASLAGRDITPLRVHSTFAAPAHPRVYEQAFGCPVHFSSPANEVIFPLSILDLPIISADPTLASAIDTQIAHRLAASPTSLADQVRHELSRHLRGEVPTLATIARSLGLSERALQRSLHSEGLSFRAILDDLRRHLAAEYLRDPRHTLADITFFLGLSEPAVLHRFSRRWFGMTPGEFRRKSTHPPSQSHTP